MARFSRIDVIVSMRTTGLVPIFYHSEEEVCRNVIMACYTGGIKVFEFTNRGDFAHEVFSDIGKWAEKELPDMILGTGSVVDSATASLYIQSGSSFIVSPVMNPEMARVCNRRKILWIPGCGTLTEINNAEELGAEIVKIFPGSSVGGPDFVKSVKGPCPWTSIMPAGGVEPTEENLKEWFSAGAACVGMGSNLFQKDLIQKKDWKGITEKIKETVNIIKAVRSH